MSSDNNKQLQQERTVGWATTWMVDTESGNIFRIYLGCIVTWVDHQLIVTELKVSEKTRQDGWVSKYFFF